MKFKSRNMEWLLVAWCSNHFSWKSVNCFKRIRGRWTDTQTRCHKRIHRHRIWKL